RAEPVVASILDVVANASSVDESRARLRALLTPEALSALGVPETGKEIVVQQFATQWMHVMLITDPAVPLSQLRVPVLALGGSLDLQVDASANLAAIKAALKKNPDVTIQEIEGLNHLFQTAKTGSPAEYGAISETFSPKAMDIVSGWITARFGK